MIIGRRSLRAVVGSVRVSILVLAAVSLACPALAQTGAAPPAGPLSLEQCVEIALANNPGLAISRAQLAESQGGRLSSYSNLLPSLQVQSAYVRATSQFSQPRVNEAGQVVSGNERITSKYYTIRSGVSQNLIAPADWFRFRAAGHDVTAARQGLRASRAETVYQVRQSYYLLLRAIWLEQVTSEALQVANEQLNRSQALFDVGSVARADVLQATVNAASAERDEINARNAIEQQRALLAALMGVDPLKPMEIRTDIPEEPAGEPDEPALVRSALEVRPEVQQARSRVLSAEELHRSAFWSLLPWLDGALFWQKQDPRWKEVVDLGQLDQDAQWGFQIGLTWNVFDGLNSIGNLKTASAGVSLARESQRQEELNAAVGIREAVVATKNAREGITAAEKGVTQAEENLRLQQALYENGGGTILDVNTAQAALTKARIDLIDARISLHLAIAQLERAVGEGG